MLLREITVYCENHTEHINTLRVQNAKTLYIYMNSVHTSQETHYVSGRKPNRLMLFREIIAVYCENHTEHIDTLCGQNAEFQYVTAGGTYTNHWTDFEGLKETWPDVSGDRRAGRQFSIL
jgi:hypothetical protein